MTDLQYVHSYAVRDRSNSFHLSRIDRDHPNLTPEAIAKAILPSDEDDSIINSNFSTLISRVLVQYLPFFNLGFQDVVIWHIQHQYYNEMSQLSEVVCNGFIIIATLIYVYTS